MAPRPRRSGSTDRSTRTQIVLVAALIAAFGTAIAAGPPARAQERRCFIGEELVELEVDSDQVFLSDGRLFFPESGATFFLPEPADEVDIVVESGAGPVFVAMVSAGQTTLETELQASEPSRVSGGPAELVFLAGAGNEGQLLELCYRTIPPPPPETPPPVVVTEQPPVTAPPVDAPPRATGPPEPPEPPPDGGGSLGGWVAAVGTAVAVGFAGWRWSVRRGRIKLRREWEPRAEDQQRSDRCTPGEMYCRKISAEVDVALRKFTEVTISAERHGNDVPIDKAHRSIPSELSSAYLARIGGEDDGASSQRLADAASRLSADLAVFGDDHPEVQTATIQAAFEGSSIEVTFHLMLCTPRVGGTRWREIDRWSPKAGIKDEGTTSPRRIGLRDTAPSVLRGSALAALLAFVKDIARFQRNST